jgi:hypothetical protein
MISGIFDFSNFNFDSLSFNILSFDILVFDIFDANSHFVSVGEAEAPVLVVADVAVRVVVAGAAPAEVSERDVVAFRRLRSVLGTI